MVIKNSLSFVYDGISSDSMGIVNVNLDTDLEEIFLPDTDVKEVYIRGRDKPYFFGVERQTLTLSLTFAFLNTFDNAQIRKVAKWLMQDTYKPLYFTDNPNRIFYCMCVGSPKLITRGLEQGYVELEFKCNSPYSYLPETIKTFSNITPTFTRASTANNVSDGTLVAVDTPRFDYPQNLFTDNQAQGNGWTKAEESTQDTGKLSFTSDANGVSIRTLSSITNWAGANASIISAMARGKTLTFTVYDIEVSGLTSGNIKLLLEDNDGSTYQSNTSSLITANGTYTLTVTKTARTNLVTLYGIFRMYNVNAGVTIKFKKAQLEEGIDSKPYILPSKSKGIFIEENSSNGILKSDPIIYGDLSGYGSVTMTSGICSWLTGGVYFGDNTVTRSIYLNYTLTPNTTYTFSYFIKMDDGSVPQIDTTGNGGDITKDITVRINGTVYGYSNLTVQPYGNIYRISITHTTVATITYHKIEILKLNSMSAKGFKISGFQMEAKPYATSYIPTSGSAVSRSGEAYSFPSNLISPIEGTWEQKVYINSMAKRQISGTYPKIFTIQRADAGNGIIVYHSPSSANWVLETRNDANVTTSISIADSFTPDGWHTFAVTWKATEAKFFIDGVLRGTIANPKLPSSFYANAYIGCQSSTSELNTTHKDVYISSIARTDADIQQRFKNLILDEYVTYCVATDATKDGYISCANSSDAIIYPEIELTVINGGDVEVINTTTNQSFKFTGVATNEIIYINCETGMIISNIPNTYRYSQFTGQLINLSIGENKINFSNANVTIRYQGKLLQ